MVGRQDTGDLEAQVRGSKHAWTFRIISAESLEKLVALKENTELASVSKIHGLLIPFEYTRLDKIIDIAFTVAEDATTVAASERADVEQISNLSGAVFHGAAVDERRPYSPTPAEIVSCLRERIISALTPKYAPFIKKSRALYWTADRSVRAAITISKEYEAGDFWYGYHPDWDQFLKEDSTGLFVLGCVGKDEAFAIPYDWIHGRLGPSQYYRARRRQALSHPAISGHNGKAGFTSQQWAKREYQSIRIDFIENTNLARIHG